VPHLFGLQYRKILPSVLGGNTGSTLFILRTILLILKLNGARNYLAVKNLLIYKVQLASWWMGDCLSKLGHISSNNMTQVQKDCQKMIKPKSKQTTDHIHRSQNTRSRAETTNFCISGIMSHCGAGTNWQEQKRCKFAQKSSISNKCMYYIESIDGHCDCLEAQLEINS
jgi:hypothetical protein